LTRNFVVCLLLWSLIFNINEVDLENHQLDLSCVTEGGFHFNNWKLGIAVERNDTVIFNSFSFDEIRIQPQSLLTLTINAHQGKFDISPYAQADVYITTPHFLAADHKFFIVGTHITHYYAPAINGKLAFPINLTNSVNNAAEWFYSMVDDKSNITEQDFIARGRIDLQVKVNGSIGILGRTNYLKLGLTSIANLEAISLDVTTPENAEQTEARLDGEEMGKILPNRRERTIAVIPLEQQSHEVYVEWKMPLPPSPIPIYEIWPYSAIISGLIGISLTILIKDIIWDKIVKPRWGQLKKAIKSLMHTKQKAH